jgi:hypothetical protein
MSHAIVLYISIVHNYLLFVGGIVTAMLSRRKIIGLAIAVMGGTSVARLIPEGAAQRLTDNLGAMGSLENLRALGRMSMGLMPQDQASLLKIAGIENAVELADQVAGFAHKRHEDFLLGRTQIVSGWVLADAECAMSVLCSQA